MQERNDMGIRYVIGENAAAVTKQLYGEMLRRIEDKPEQRIYYFVPEQATLQAQKDLAAMHPTGCVMNIDILPFKRLVYRLKEEHGDVIPPVMDDIGKGMLVKRVLLQENEKLSLYRGKAEKPGFVQEMKSMLSEFARYTITAEQLTTVAEQVNDGLVAHKLRDMSCVMSGFRNALENAYITEEEIYSVMCPWVERSKLLRGSIIYFDGFTGLTPSQYELVRSLLRVCDELTVAVTMDPALYGRCLSEQHLFTMSAKLIRVVSQLGEETGHRTLLPVLLSAETGEPSLGHLRKEIFRYPVQAYDAPPEITMYAASDMESEVRYVVGRLVELVRNQGYRYDELAILCGDVEGYSEAIRMAMERADIPYFIDYKNDVMSNPLIDYIRSLLRVLVTDFRAEQVIRFMKNPLGDYDFTAVCHLENALLAHGIRGYSKWKRGFSTGYSEKRVCHEEEIDALVNRLMEELSPLRTQMKEKKSTEARVGALYEFLRAHDTYARMEALAEKMCDSTVPGNKRREAEYRGIYENVMLLFEQTVYLLGNTQLSLAEFASVLDAGFAELKPGVIPPLQDCVTIGDVKRSRLGSVRQLFFLGVNEGIVPGGGNSPQLLTQKEREKLKEMHGMELSETEKESVSTEEFYLYLALTKPSEHLTVSWRRGGEERRELRPSYVVHRLLRMFPQLKVTTESDEKSFFARIAHDGGVEAYLRSLRERAKETPETEAVVLQTWFENHPGYKGLPEHAEKLKRGEEFTGNERLHADLARALYSQSLRGSVSRLECYAECAYRHFLKYGLQLEERKEFRASSLDIGNAFHDALRRYSEKVAQSEESFRTIAPEVAARYMDEAVEEMLASPSREIFTANQRNAYLSVKMRHTLQRMLWVITEQLKRGSFEPKFFEKYFRYNSERLQVHGVIDRIDVFEDGDNTWYKVIDYKTGKKTLDLAHMFFGLDLQLPAYVGAVEREVLPGAKPAAAFYCRVEDPLVEECDDPQTAVLAALRPNGMLLENRELIRHLDNGIPDEGAYTSPVIPVKTLKSGAFGADSQAISTEQMSRLTKHTLQVMEHEAEAILSGDVGRRPYRYGGETGCDYCEYAGICGKERGGSMQYRNLVADKEELWKDIFERTEHREDEER